MGRGPPAEWAAVPATPAPSPRGRQDRWPCEGAVPVGRGPGARNPGDRLPVGRGPAAANLTGYLCLGRRGGSFRPRRHGWAPRSTGRGVDDLGQFSPACGANLSTISDGRDRAGIRSSEAQPSANPFGCFHRGRDGPTSARALLRGRANGDVPPILVPTLFLTNTNCPNPYQENGRFPGRGPGTAPSLSGPPDIKRVLSGNVAREPPLPSPAPPSPAFLPSRTRGFPSWGRVARHLPPKCHPVGHIPPLRVPWREGGR